MIIFFLKAHQMSLFDAPVPIKAHSTKTGGYVRAHTRIMKVSAKTPKQTPMDLDFENVANLINNMHNTPDNQQKTGEKKMEKITYTFPESSPYAALRGRTFTGGTFCRRDGKRQGEPDAVNFGLQTVDGKEIILKVGIAGRPELEAALADKKAAEAARKARLDAIGWPEYQAAQNKAINARDAYDAASRYGYPSRQAAAMRAADEALTEAARKYPLAAAYAKAESYSFSSNDMKSAAGNRAMRSIESGEDPILAIEKMEQEWSAAAARAVDNN